MKGTLQARTTGRDGEGKPGAAKRPVPKAEVSPWPGAGVVPVFRCACGGSCPRCTSSAPASGLRVSQPGDPLEIEADRVADQVMRMAEPEAVDRPSSRGEEERQRRPAEGKRHVATQTGVADDAAIGGAFERRIQSLGGRGRPLAAAERSFFESRLGFDLGGVRIHTDSPAGALARSVAARAFTNGRDVVFGANEYAPGTLSGRRLLAHELTHVVQQSRGQGATRLLRQAREEEAVESIEQQVAEAAAQEAIQGMIDICDEFPPSLCPAPSLDCPSCFCSPLPLSRGEILVFRDLVARVALPGISAKVSPRVVPLWRDYLFGGSSLQDLSSTFGADFTASQTTLDMNKKVEAALRGTINPRRRLPSAIDIPSRIPTLVRQMKTPNHDNEMNFDVIGEVPGNIAGGIGADQTSCPVGAQPSSMNDSRGIEGTARIVRNSPQSVTVEPDMFYLVEDTVDLCPGNCGALQEQIATLPFSWMEASGVSGDVPFKVRFPSGLAPFTVTA